MSNYREELAKAKIQELIRQGKNPDHHFDDDIHWYKHKYDPYIPPSEDDRKRWGKEEEKTNKQKTFWNSCIVISLVLFFIGYCIQSAKTKEAMTTGGLMAMIGFIGFPISCFVRKSIY
jgi:hypothetical protein